MNFLDVNFKREFHKLNSQIVDCFRCPRLVAHRESIAQNPPLRYRGQIYWARPLPGFGSYDARIHIVGLAPAANGGNRTGRIFTGDRSGDWLYAALHDTGLANQPISVSREDGLRLRGVYVSAAVRCAPPDNKPTLQEFDTCRPYLQREFELLPGVVVYVALGAIAYGEIKKVLKGAEKRYSVRFPLFGHGVEVALPEGRFIVCSYHPSQQNTFTGRLTKPMFQQIFERARKLAGL